MLWLFFSGIAAWAIGTGALFVLSAKALQRNKMFAWLGYLTTAILSTGLFIMMFAQVLGEWNG